MAVKCLEEWSSTPTALIASSCKQASLSIFISYQNGHNLLLMHRLQRPASVFFGNVFDIYLKIRAAQPFECSQDHIWWRATLSDKVEVGQNLPPPPPHPHPLLCRDGCQKLHR